ncbi:hypothetical protein FOL47_005539 [Perkinsus chesapeaki]|uniref:Immunoglobulin super DCC subclass member n=1 Tax=Perkinsus chesapeaki TaxID=330153 RepID=A0A7J6LXY7_PERCH|nr:hypothetical protein FOL47_005539 [Perkinsus chesapeaki]
MLFLIEVILGFLWLADSLSPVSSEDRTRLKPVATATTSVKPRTTTPMITVEPRTTTPTIPESLYPYKAPSNPDLRCPPGLQLAIHSYPTDYGWNTFNDFWGYVCTVSCEKDSDCPPPKGGTAIPLCHDGFCELDCKDADLGCPSPLACPVGLRFGDVSTCIDPLTWGPKLH